MSINLIFIILTLEFILFIALMYLIISTSDKIKEADELLDKEIRTLRKELSDLRVSVNIIKRQIEDNIYSEKLLRKEVKAFGSSIAFSRLRKLLKLSGKGSSSGLLFNIWRLKSVFIHSLKFIR